MNTQDQTLIALLVFISTLGTGIQAAWEHETLRTILLGVGIASLILGWVAAFTWSVITLFF